MRTPNPSKPICMDEIFVRIPSIEEAVTASLKKLRPKFNLTDDQIAQLGRRPVASLKR